MDSEESVLSTSSTGDSDSCDCLGDGSYNKADFSPLTYQFILSMFLLLTPFCWTIMLLLVGSDIGVERQESNNLTLKLVPFLNFILTHNPPYTHTTSPSIDTNA